MNILENTMTVSDILQHPIFFAPNRVERCYSGGLMLEKMLAYPEPDDNHCPEEWLASTTEADNENELADEGLSRIYMSDGSRGPLLRDLLADADIAPSGVLCKFLDSAVRLPLQCHPDRIFSRQHFHSDFGKTEAWFVLDTRSVAGEKPYLLFGFKPGVREEDFSAAIMAQDIARAESMLHRVPVIPGDSWFIPGGIPHAIGPGCLILEVMEPTDLVVQPERHIGDIHLSDRTMWGGLEPSVAMKCFNYASADKLENIQRRLQLFARDQRTTNGALLEKIITEELCECFCVDRITVTGKAIINAQPHLRIAIITAGEGAVSDYSGYIRKVTTGEHFLWHESTGPLELEAAGDSMSLYLVAAQPLESCFL